MQNKELFFRAIRPGRTGRDSKNMPPHEQANHEKRVAMEMARVAREQAERTSRQYMMPKLDGGRKGLDNRQSVEVSNKAVWLFKRYGLWWWRFKGQKKSTDSHGPFGSTEEAIQNATKTLS